MMTELSRLCPCHPLALVRAAAGRSASSRLRPPCSNRCGVNCDAGIRIKWIQDLPAGVWILIPPRSSVIETTSAVVVLPGLAGQVDPHLPVVDCEVRHGKNVHQAVTVSEVRVAVTS